MKYKKLCFSLVLQKGIINVMMAELGVITSTIHHHSDPATPRDMRL